MEVEGSELWVCYFRMVEGGDIGGYEGAVEDEGHD